MLLQAGSPASASAGTNKQDLDVNPAMLLGEWTAPCGELLLPKYLSATGELRVMACRRHNPVLDDNRELLLVLVCI